MPLSAARTMQPHRPKEYEREGMPVFEDDTEGWDDFAVEVAGRRFGVLTEHEARRSCEQSADAGMAAVLLRRDGHDWVEVERYPAAGRLTTLNARPYSHWSR